MALFDRVWIGCPQCSYPIQIQTRAGNCSMMDYTLVSAPQEILLSISKGEINCDGCESKWQLLYPGLSLVRRVWFVAPDYEHFEIHTDFMQRRIQQ